MDFLTRATKWLFGIALILAVTLWFAARRGDRGVIEEQVTIDRPASAVFRWISSDEFARRWISDLVELRKADGGASPFASSSLEIVELIRGHRVEMTVRTTRVIPNQELGLQISSGDFVSGGFAGDADFQLLGSGEYTRLVFTSHTRYAAMKDRVFEPLLTYAARQKMRDDLARLKLLVEAEPAATTNLRAAATSR
jgi:uncharacterized protein YndB with AHSA1/START domain